MHRRISEVLPEGGGEIHTLGPDATVAEAVALMNRANVGAVMVVEADGRLVGIFTERDVLRRVIDGRLDYDGTRLDAVMTGKVATLRPDTTVEEALRLVDRVGCRHLPVVADDRIHGMISIRDLTRSLVQEREEEIAQLTDYIAGGYGHHGG